MSKNTGRNILLIVLGYYLLTGNFKAARNLVIAYLAIMLTIVCVCVGISYKANSDKKRRMAYELEVQAQQKLKDKQEAQQLAADVLPFFVKQFEGKTLKGNFLNYVEMESYSVRFKVINDSILSYQTCEYEEYSDYLFDNKQKWSKSKQTSYSLVPATTSNGDIIKGKLTFQFENYRGELDVIKSGKKNKYKIIEPFSLRDSNNVSSLFFN